MLWPEFFLLKIPISQNKVTSVCSYEFVSVFTYIVFSVVSDFKKKIAMFSSFLNNDLLLVNEGLLVMTLSL